MLVRVPSKDSKTVVNALIKQAHKLPRELYKSLTWDRGSEMASHKRFSLATDVRPRETLNFETPAERFNQCVASTG